VGEPAAGQLGAREQTKERAARSLSLDGLQTAGSGRIIGQVQRVRKRGSRYVLSDCGASDQTPKSYCRRCGEWLADRAGRSSAKPEQRMNVMVVFNALSALMTLFAAIALYATYLDTPEAKNRL